MDADNNRSYDPKIDRKLYQNNNPFVVRRYNGRIKKCCGCKVAFQGATVKPEFVVAHRELCVYGRVKGSKRLLMTERDVFYHCDATCIQPRHPYFHESLIVMHPAFELNDNDVEHLRSLDIFRNMCSGLICVYNI